MRPEQPMDTLILAAGRGERLGLGPKAFVFLGGITLLDMVLAKARPLSRRVYVGYPPGWEKRMRAHSGEGVIPVAGGITRQRTIEILMQQAEADLLLVLDVARPLASPELMTHVANQARRHGAAVACTHPLIPALVPEGAWLRHTLGRDQYLLPQSPQAYRRDVLERICAWLHEKGLELQTTHEAAAAAGIPVRLVEGETANIKITTNADLKLARFILEETEAPR